MRCRQVLEVVASEWGSGDPLPRPVREHLAGCERCAAESRRVAEALAGVSELDVPDPGPEYWTSFLPRVRARIEEAPSRPVPGRLRSIGDLLFPARWSPARLAAAAALAVILAGAAAARLGWLGNPSGTVSPEASIETRLDEELAAAGNDAAIEVDAMLIGAGSYTSLEETDLDPDSLQDALGEVVASLSTESLRDWDSMDEMIEGLSEEETKALIDELKPEQDEPAFDAKEDSAG